MEEKKNLHEVKEKKTTPKRPLLITALSSPRVKRDLKVGKKVAAEGREAIQPRGGTLHVIGGSRGK